MNLKSIWSVLEKAYEPIDKHVMMSVMESASALSLPPDWFNWAAAGLIFGAQPISIGPYMHLFPYGLARVTEDGFASAAKQGYLIADMKGGYRLSDIGANIVQQLNQTADASVAQLQPMPAEHLQRLVDYFLRLADASFAAPEPSGKWLCSYKRNNMNPGKDASLPRQFIYYFDQVAAYRDDAYVALWQAHQVEGHAWNTLDRLYKGGALTFDGLYEKLKAWDVPQEVYAQDVQELIQRGWIKEKSGEYQITPAGKQVREDVEVMTEHNFFIRWTCLNETEQEDLLSLATQLRDGRLNSKE